MQAIQIQVGPRVARRVADGFDARPYTDFGVRGLTPTIGAEVAGIDLGRPLSDTQLAELRRALLEWKVLFFRDQHISRSQQRAFAERWGSLHQHPFMNYVNPGQCEADVVTLAKDAQTAGVENEWHADVTWHSHPPLGAVLRAVEVPALGGDTLWLDAAAAYDGLAEDVKARIERLRAVHDWQHTFGLAMPSEDRARLAPLFPPAEHPIVRIHPETRRRTLFVNPLFTQGVVGLEPADSEALLRVLYRQLERPEYQCRFRWCAGDVAFWDNRATQHYAASDYYPERRVMDRVAIRGERPYGPSAE